MLNVQVMLDWKATDQSRVNSQKPWGYKTSLCFFLQIKSKRGPLTAVAELSGHPHSVLALSVKNIRNSQIQEVWDQMYGWERNSFAGLQTKKVSVLFRQDMFFGFGFFFSCLRGNMRAE